jgi:arginine decarboxylase
MPDLVSESGRALTAHHAVLVTNVTATEAFPRQLDFAIGADTHPVVRNLAALLDQAGDREPEETFLEAEHWLEEGRNLFLYGDLPLADRARLEPLYFAALERLGEQLDPEHRRHRELRDRLRYQLSDKYFINLSIFQSLPDIWAIDQVFPIVPLQRLDEAPDRRAVLEDLTCDSDGRIDHYVERGLLEPTLPVHALRAGEAYLLGIFLAGAYQETLGDIHNLFGDTDSVDVAVDGEHFALRNRRPGDTADSLLELVGFQPRQLLAACRAKVAAAGLAREEAERVERLLAEGLSAYTYLAGD